MNSDQELANAFADFFSAKIVRIRDEWLVRKEQLGELIQTSKFIKSKLIH